MRRARVALAAVVLVALALTGCVTIPSSGDVATTEVSGSDVGDNLLSRPDSPAADASPQEIVEGFLRAGRGSQNGYAVAIEYLTPEFAAKWLPTDRVLLSSTPISPTLADDGTYTVSIAVSAEIDAQGHYSTNQPASAETLGFTLAQDADEQWRIAEAPNGTVLPPSRLTPTFEPYALYYFDPTFDFLVPDVRWFTSNRTVGSRIVSALLGDPPATLAGGAVVSVFPPGAELTGQVTTASGIATVPLSEVSGESDVTKRRIRQQLTASLSGLGNVRSVTVTVGDFPLAIDDGGRQAVVNPQVGPEPIGGVDGAFGAIGTDGVTPLSGIRTAADGIGATAGSLARTRDAVAVRGADGAVVLVRSSGDPVQLDTRPGLIAPSLDSWGYTWTVPATDPAAAAAIPATGVATPIDLGLPEGSTVVSLDVARDGARVLVAGSTPSGPRLFVSAILRDATGIPIGLGPAQDLAVGTSALVDAAWIDGTQIVTLSRPDTTSAGTDVDAYVLGGLHTFLGSLADGRTIVGGNTTAGVRVLDGTGAIRRPSGSSWTDTGLRASFLATQQ